MLHISKLSPADISFIIGVWHGTMGMSDTRNLRSINNECAETWYTELKKTRRLESRLLGSTYSSDTSLQMSVNKKGFICVHLELADNSGCGNERYAAKKVRGCSRYP